MEQLEENAQIIFHCQSSQKSYKNDMFLITRLVEGLVALPGTSPSSGTSPDGRPAAKAQSGPSHSAKTRGTRGVTRQVTS